MEENTTQAPKPGRKISKKKIIIIAGVVVILALVVFVFIRRQNINWNDDKLTTAEQRILVSKIGDLMVLPDEPQPVFAVVTDAEALRAEQAFYAGVQNGDVLLVLPSSRKAIIYSVKGDKIVNAGPFIVTSEN